MCPEDPNVLFNEFLNNDTGASGESGNRKASKLSGSRAFLSLQCCRMQKFCRGGWYDFSSEILHKISQKCSNEIKEIIKMARKVKVYGHGSKPLSTHKCKACMHILSLYICLLTQPRTDRLASKPN